MTEMLSDDKYSTRCSHEKKKARVGLKEDRIP